MVKKKTELQIPLQYILTSKKGKHGVLFQIKIAHYKPMWVPEMKLSKVALQCFVTGSPLPKKAYVVLERGYAKAPVKEQMKNIISFFSTKRKAPTNEQLEEQSHATKKARSEEDVPLTPQKKKRSYRPMLMEGWCG